MRWKSVPIQQLQCATAGLFYIDFACNCVGEHAAQASNNFAPAQMRSRSYENSAEHLTHNFEGAIQKLRKNSKNENNKKMRIIKKMKMKKIYSGGAGIRTHDLV